MPKTERKLAKQRQEVRSLGLKKLIVGGAVSVLMLLWLMSGKPSASGGAFKLVLFALPLVVAMMGFLEPRPASPFRGLAKHGTNCRAGSVACSVWRFLLWSWL